MSKSAQLKVYFLIATFLIVAILPLTPTTKALDSKFITIQSNGEISPETAPIQKQEDTYILTENLTNCHLIIQKNNTIINGANHQITVNNDLENKPAIELKKTQNITLKNLNIKGYNNQYNSNIAILIEETKDAIIKECKLTDIAQGISIINSNNIKITKNRITNSSSVGITIRNSKTIQITNNTISANKNSKRIHGIYLSIDNALISKNHISECLYGIEINGCFNTTLHRNYFTKNQIGIYIIYGGKNLVTENTVINSKSFGIILSSRERNPGNIIYHNNFINNNMLYNTDQLQVSNPWFFGPEDNIWDNGKEGNYWSDYKQRYPQAKEVNQSGVYDTAFYINPENIDNFPLLDLLTFPIVEPTPTPSPISEPEFPTTAILASLVVLAIVTVVSFVYFKKRTSK